MKTKTRYKIQQTEAFLQEAFIVDGDVKFSRLVEIPESKYGMLYELNDSKRGKFYVALYK